MLTSNQQGWRENVTMGKTLLLLLGISIGLVAGYYGADYLNNRFFERPLCEMRNNVRQYEDRIEIEEYSRKIYRFSNITNTSSSQPSVRLMPFIK